MKNKFLVLFLSLSLGMLTSCSSDDNSISNPDDNKGPLVKPEVTLVVDEVQSSSVEFSVTSQKAEKVSYLLLPATDQDLEVQKVLTQGVALELNKTLNLKHTELDYNTQYDLYLAAESKDKQTVLIKERFTTLDNTVLEMVDGFMMYDGVDQTTGLYRINLIMSTKMMDQSANGTPYKDVLVWLYTTDPLVKVNDKFYNVPFGKAFALEQQDSWKPLMYQVGKHVTGSDGEPNFQGTAWIDFDQNGQQQIFVADNTSLTSIEIIDNKDGSYTVEGKLVDKEFEQELTFTFTDDKGVFGW